MKKISGKDPMRFLESRNNINEAMDLAIPYLASYFDEFHSHAGFDDIPTNAFCCYTLVNIKPNVLRRIDISIDIEDPVFFENKIHETTVGTRINVIGIYVRDTFAGYYLPEKNTLIATDWTHNRSTIRMLGNIVNELVAKLNLRPLTPEQRNSENTIILTANNVLVGCDPEFEVINDCGDIINASEVIDDDDNESAIGVDGAGAQLELRPEPGSPGKVVQNIRKLIQSFSEEYDEYDLTDAGNKYPLGGHIHIGIGDSYRPDAALVELLDDFIGRPTINLSGEARRGYKKLGAYRIKPWGFEYRSAPSCVFQNPLIAYCVMKVAKNICAKFFNKETFLYNETPDINDYVQIGGLTEKQARNFLSFTNGSFKPSKSIRAMWKVPALETAVSKPVITIRPQEIHTVTVTLRDRWSTASRQAMQNLRTMIVSRRDINIVVYGLQEERGMNLCTIDHPECRTYRSISHRTWAGSYEDGNRTLYIGVSRNIRLATTNMFVTLLAEAINRRIQEDQ